MGEVIQKAVLHGPEEALESIPAAHFAPVWADGTPLAAGGGAAVDAEALAAKVAAKAAEAVDADALAEAVLAKVDLEAVAAKAAELAPAPEASEAPAIQKAVIPKNPSMLGMAKALVAAGLAVMEE